MGRVALVAVVLAFLPGVAVGATDPPDPGQTTSGTVTSNGTEYRYISYTPASYVPGRAAPLLVMVHGCQTTAEQEMRVTLYNRLAEREGFVVLYPDVDALGRAQPGPANQCWKFPYPPAWTRGNSDAAAIADMTRHVIAKRTIDRERVYLVGISAGGLMASIEAAAYPDLYAAVGVSASSAYTDWTCFTTGVGIPAATSAQLAFEQMGPRARIVPRFVLGGDADLAFPWTCTAKALEQGLRTNNLVLGASQEGPIPLTAAAVRRKQKPGGHAYTVASYRDPAGCLIGESWRVHGMGHFWSGGTTDPKYAGYTDTKGPSAAEASWAFLKRYRKSDTGMPCTEAPVGCLNARGGIRGTRLGASHLGRTRKRQRQAIKGRIRSRRGGIDRYCVRGGGAMRIGYPTKRLRRGRLHELVRRRKSQALLSLTSSRRFELKGLRVGSPTKTLRHKLRHERRFTIGHNSWYVVAGRRSRLLFQVRGGRVRQIGIGSKAMTTTRDRAQTFLRGWQLRALGG